MKRLVLIFISIACWPGLMKAQPLADLIIAADSMNLELKALYQEYLAALEKGPQVSQLPDPEAGLGVFVLPVETRLGPQWVRLSVTQMFPWMGTLQAREDVAVGMARVRFERIAASRLEVHYQIRLAYYDLYEKSRQQEIIRRRIDLLKGVESVATTKVGSAKATLADVLRVQVRIRDLEEQITLIENQKIRPVALINQLLNREAGSPVIPADSLPEIPVVPDRDGMLASIREQHPMIRMLSLQQEVSESAIRLNALEGKPSFTAGLDYITVGQRTDADPPMNGRDIVSPRVGVRIPLYREKYRARTREEKMTIQALELRREDQFLRYRTALESAMADLQNQQIRHDLAFELRALTASVLDLLTTQYSNDGTGFIDLLQVEDQLLQYDLMLLNTDVAMHKAYAEMQRYLP